MRSPTFFVDQIPVYGDVILAPMAGYADVPMRALARAFGSAMQYTEFVAAEEILSDHPSVPRLLDFKADEHPRVMQIFSHSADTLLAAAHKIMPLAPDIIDINMGCSTRRVSGRGAGVGMMRNPREVARTFELLAKELPIPVTGKIRLGWKGAENFVEIGRIAQESGASLIAIHPRTKEQKYSGKSNWEAIAELKQTLSIPVVGNGDIESPQDIDAMLDYTGCDAVMVGRAAIGNPWIIGRKYRHDLTPADLYDMIALHATEMVAYHGERGVILFRKMLKRYLTGVISPEEMRSFLRIERLAELLPLIAQSLDVEPSRPAPLPEGEGSRTARAVSG